MFSSVPVSVCPPHTIGSFAALAMTVAMWARNTKIVHDRFGRVALLSFALAIVTCLVFLELAS